MQGDKNEHKRLSRSSTSPSQEAPPPSRRLSTSAKRNTLGRSTFKNTDAYFLAVESGDLEIVRQYVPAKDKPNKQNQLGKTGLHIAGRFGHVAIMEYLVAQGADVNFDGKPQDLEKQGFDDRGSFRRLPIHDATENGQLAAVSFLISSGSKVDEKDATGLTPLHLATKEGHRDVVTFLCKQGAKLDTTNVRDDSEEIGDTTLLIALNYDHRDIAIDLVQRGANFGIRNKDGKSAYLIAFQKDFADVIAAMDQQLALEEQDRFVRAGLDFSDENRNSLFHHAAIIGDINAINMLYRLGGNPTLTNKKGRNPLFLAAKHGQKEAMILFYNLGVSHTETDNYDISPSEIANKYEHSDCVALLQEWPAPQKKDAEDDADNNSDSSSSEKNDDQEITSNTAQHRDLDLQPLGNLEDAEALLRRMIAEAESLPTTNHSAAAEPLDTPTPPQPLTNQTSHNDKLSVVLKECQIILAPNGVHRDPELEEFLELLRQTSQLEQICDIATKSGSNFLAMIAKYDPDRKLLPTLKYFSPIQLKKMLQFKTTTGENCLHIACQFLFIELFELCVSNIEISVLVDMAKEKTIDKGFTPFHILCAASHDDKAKKRKQLAESEHFLTQPVQREELTHLVLPDNLTLLMVRIGVVFGENPDIFDSLDSEGNTGLMLCTYTLDSTLIGKCIASIKDPITQRLCLLQINETTKLNPLQYIATMGDAASLQLMMSVFENEAPQVCIEQQLLQWTHFTTVPYDKASLIRSQLYSVLEFLISQYFWDQTKQAYTEQFKEIIVNEFRGLPLITRSLVNCGGVLIEYLLKAKYIPRKPEILFLLMHHMAPVVQPYSPRGFSNHSSGLDADHRSPKLNDVAEPLINMRRQLLHRIFRISWPDDLINSLATYIVSILGTPRYTSMRSTSDEKLLRIIESFYCDPNHSNLSADYSVLILACFYQVTLASQKKEQIEMHFMNHIRDNPDAMLFKIKSLYHFLLNQSQDLAQGFLEELFDGNSLLKKAFIELFPDQVECLKGDKTNFMAYSKELLSDNKNTSDESTCIIL